MFYLLFIFAVFNSVINMSMGEKCNYNDCSLEAPMVCGFDEKKTEYKMFVSECAMKVYNICNSVDVKKTPLQYCMKQYETIKRRMYGVSCPTFCPSHYRPVCGSSETRSYIYRTFNNGCYLDMINCRGGEDNGYVEVPMSYCQGHLMKNIFKDQVVITGLNDYRDYQE